MYSVIIFCIIALVSGKPQPYKYDDSNGLTHDKDLHGNDNLFAAVTVAPVQLYASSHTATPLPHHHFTSAGSPLYYGSSRRLATFSNGQYGLHELQHQQSEPIISKHFYFHSAPEEDEEELLTQQINLGPARKNYRVVFIKAPTQSARATALSIAQAQNEDKTVIYVLSKKTDPAEIQAHIQTIPTLPSKPDVFFIKYKTPEEAAHAQQHIQAQYDALGGTSHVSDEEIAPVSSVIKSPDSHHQAIHVTEASIASNTVTAASNYLPPDSA